jgi:hypothetical protein
MCGNLCIPLATEIYGDLETLEKPEANTILQEKIKAVNIIHNYM